MIISIKHKGLRNFFEKGDESGVHSAHVKRIRKILSVLQAAQTIQDINVPGLDLHPLKGNMKGFWAVSVSGNYRIVFVFDSAKIEVYDVDYTDYH